MSNGFHPETVPELARYIEYQFAGVKTDIRHLNDRLDRQDVITRDQHKEDLERLKAEIIELDADLRDYQARTANLVKWFVTSLIIPGIGTIAAVYAVFNGG